MTPILLIRSDRRRGGLPRATARRLRRSLAGLAALMLLAGCETAPPPAAPEGPPRLGALQTMTRPPSAAAYPSLSSVPLRPTYVATPDQRAVLERELEADRDALQAGRSSGPAQPVPEGLADLPPGDVAAVDRRRLLSGNICSGCDLRRADLRRANLRQAILTRSDLSRADLGGANLREADLSAVNLRGADLRGADLTDATLSGASLTGTRLGGAILCRTTMPDDSIETGGCPAEPSAQSAPPVR